VGVKVGKKKEKRKITNEENIERNERSKMGRSQRKAETEEGRNRKYKGRI
jgi:hypothetical protein